MFPFLSFLLFAKNRHLYYQDLFVQPFFHISSSLSPEENTLLPRKMAEIPSRNGKLGILAVAVKRSSAINLLARESPGIASLLSGFKGAQTSCRALAQVSHITLGFFFRR